MPVDAVVDPRHHTAAGIRRAKPGLPDPAGFDMTCCCDLSRNFAFLSESVSLCPERNSGRFAMELAVSQSNKHKLRVLFVDDDESIAGLLESELPRMGHDATVCRSWI